MMSTTTQQNPKVNVHKCISVDCVATQLVVEVNRGRRLLLLHYLALQDVLKVIETQDIAAVVPIASGIPAGRAPQHTRLHTRGDQHTCMHAPTCMHHIRLLHKHNHTYMHTNAAARHAHSKYN